VDTFSAKTTFFKL